MLFHCKAEKPTKGHENILVPIEIFFFDMSQIVNSQAKFLAGTVRLNSKVPVRCDASQELF